MTRFLHANPSHFARNRASDPRDRRVRRTRTNCPRIPCEPIRPSAQLLSPRLLTDWRAEPGTRLSRPKWVGRPIYKKRVPRGTNPRCTSSWLARCNSLLKTSSTRATGLRPTATTTSRPGRDVPSAFRQGRGSKIRTRERQLAETDRSGIDRISRAAKFHLADIDAVWTEDSVSHRDMGKGPRNDKKSRAV